MVGSVQIMFFLLIFSPSVLSVTEREVFVSPSVIMEMFIFPLILSYFASCILGFVCFSFYFGCIGSSLLRIGFLYLLPAGTPLHCSALASHCSGFSCCRAQALGAQASVVAACRLSSCGTRALELVGFSSCGARAQ